MTSTTAERAGIYITPSRILRSIQAKLGKHSFANTGQGMVGRALNCSPMISSDSIRFLAGVTSYPGEKELARVARASIVFIQSANLPESLRPNEGASFLVGFTPDLRGEGNRWLGGIRVTEVDPKDALLAELPKADLAQTFLVNLTRGEAGRTDTELKKQIVDLLA